MAQQLMDPSADKVPGQLLESCSTAAFTLTSYPNMESFSTFTRGTYTMSHKGQECIRNGPEPSST